MIRRRAQERAHSLYTELPFTESSRPPTKHRSAFSWSAINMYESRYSSSASSLNSLQKSLLIAFSSALRVSVWLLHSKFIFGLSGRLHRVGRVFSCFAASVAGVHAS